MKVTKILLEIIKIPLDFSIALFAFLLAFLLRQKTDLISGMQLPASMEYFPSLREYTMTSMAFSATLIAILAWQKNYSFKKNDSTASEISKIVIGASIWLLAIISYYFIIRSFPFSRLALMQTWIITILCLSVSRVIINRIEQILYKKGFATNKIILIGNSSILYDLINYYKKNPQFNLLGIISDEKNNIKNIKHLGNINESEKILKILKPDLIVHLPKQADKEKRNELIDICRENQIEYSFVPDQLEIQKTNIEIKHILGIPVIRFRPTPLDGWGRVTKRIFDFFGSLFLLIILSPLMIIIAIIIKMGDRKSTVLFKYLDDGSPVKRVGQKGETFRFYKFRTMKPGTHNQRYTLLAEKNIRKDSPLVKIKNDPRITKFGKFLRKTSLDELPQLINVLLGNMSLVGPRPHLPEEVAKYKNHHNFVLTIKPGITGLSQTSGRSDLDFEKEIKLDTYYIENWNLILDLKILLKTALVLFKKFEE